MEIKKSTIQKVLIGLSIIFVVGLLIMILPSSNNGNDSNESSVDQSLRTVSPEEFESSLGATNSVLLDIRTPQEFESGRIEGAKNIDFYSSSFKSELDDLDKDIEYQIYCNSGNRSATALTMMKDLGFTNVIELDGGISAWNMLDKDICTNC
jgi:rhodanese-related sulfurtransferase